MMEYRRLGKSGLKVSALSYGSWVTFNKQVGVESAVEIMKTAYDAGVNFFDNAEAYEKGDSERVMGAALKKLGWRRDSYCVSSKVFWGAAREGKPTQIGLSRKHVTEACHQAMERLGVDYLDLYFCHRPDPETPIEETVWAMNDLIRQGKVLYWGTSEWTGQELMEAYLVAKDAKLIGPTMEQPQYSMLARERFERECTRVCREYGLGTTIWSPLRSGMLTGKYNKGIPENSRINLPGYEWLKNNFTSEEGKKQIETVKKLTKVAEDAGMSMTHLALAWCLKNPYVSTVILGASRVEQLKENLGAIDHVGKLTDEVMSRIDAILSE